MKNSSYYINYLFVSNANGYKKVEKIHYALCDGGTFQAKLGAKIPAAMNANMGITVQREIACSKISQILDYTLWALNVLLVKQLCGS